VSFLKENFIRVNGVCSNQQQVTRQERQMQLPSLPMSPITLTASIVALTLTLCVDFVVYQVQTVLFVTKGVIHLEFWINHKFILIFSDKEQVLPTIDADQAHALLISGHGYIDVRWVLNGSTRAVLFMFLLEKLP
jgi:hypothetical protein